ncbi:MAG: methyltransferase domain-containing protein [Spirochaetes bacterium]|jgi:2-polyprenyl-3-methyl-5-hydroxy-6-metoxy-1,4-benzoquinol methylase|nr:methyltransferase domain-containing protein [Spirochaetota bacterium]
MSDFYTLLARYYDSIFPAETEIVEFLAAELDRGARGGAGPSVIDAACGTGNYTDALAARGFDCLGFDASAEMIEIAKRSGKRGRFEVRELEELGGLEPEARSRRGGDRADAAGGADTGGPGAAAGLFCIGNSLPHLTDRGSVRAFFGDAARVVEPGGSVIVQTVNFARFTGTDAEIQLPPVERPDIRMARSYRRGAEPGTVVFHAELSTKDGERAAGDTTLLALTREELVDAAWNAGFRRIELAGSFDGSRHDASGSFLMVLTARTGEAVCGGEATRCA